MALKECKTCQGEGRGACRIYNSTIENYEQAVAFYCAVDTESEKIRQLGMWKASIIFSMMAVEASANNVVKIYFYKGLGCCSSYAKHLVSEINCQFNNRREVVKWVEKLTFNGKDKKGDKEIFKTYYKFLDYRNAAVHSNMTKSRILSDNTNGKGAYEAIGISLEMLKLIDSAFKLDQTENIKWLEEIFVSCSLKNEICSVRQEDGR